MFSKCGGTFHREEYEALKAGAIAASEAGRFPKAAHLFSQAREIASRSADPRIGDIAYCNWAGARIRLGESDGLVAPLGEVLVRSDEPAARRLAAYCISLICELKGEVEKGLFYARLAQEQNYRLGTPKARWVCSGHNQIGNLLVADSRFREALNEYSRALDAADEDDDLYVAIARQNAGFCHLMLGRPEIALALFHASLRTLCRLASTRLLTVNHLDLAQAYLELGRSRAAIHHAERALGLARVHGVQSNIKTALFLLGEAWTQDGDEVKARLFFEQLSEYYEDLPFIADLLLAVDVRQMINLGA